MHAFVDFFDSVRSACGDSRLRIGSNSHGHDYHDDDDDNDDDGDDGADDEDDNADANDEDGKDDADEDKYWDDDGLCPWPTNLAGWLAGQLAVAFFSR